ncbi:MAG: 5'/3'-nucleotidase SurE [Chloroflexota bacterium]
MNTNQVQILLTNDDGIQSPGLWAAAETLDPLGYITVAAPREQSSGAGRSLPMTSDGIIQLENVHVNGRSWPVHAVGGTPAQAVQHGALEIMPQKPNLVVSGINYGENLGVGITVSGTVGAVMEGAALGIPGLAVSLETEQKHHYSYSTEVDFSAAAYFTAYFAERLLKYGLIPDVDLIKVDIPANATPDTPWEITGLSRARFYEAILPERESWEEPGIMGYRITDAWRNAEQDSDVYAVRVKKVVAVTAISLDMTSRAAFKEIEDLLRE